MSNVFCGAWRVPCLGFRPLSMPPSISAAPLRSAVCRDHRSFPPVWRSYSSCSTARRPFAFLAPFSLPSRQSCQLGFSPSGLSILTKSFSSTGSALSQSKPPVEHGVQVRSKPFTAAELQTIFRQKVSPQVGNRALAILQGRREAGTLDLDLPRDVTRSVRQSGLDAALEWLRANRPLDEDAAIYARIEREEFEEEQRLIQRGEELGLYKPQSGTFGAERGEADDPSGKSALVEFRKKNEQRLLEEQERKRQEWLEGEEKEREMLMRQAEKNKSLQVFENSSALEARPRADPQERPLLAWYQKHHIRGMDNNPDVLKASNARRVLPSLIFTLLTITLCYFFAQNYEPPLKQDRMWPELPPAAATAIAIAGLNIGIYALWKIPPAWRMLNRHFIIVNMWPRAFSMIGSVFSHQTAKHLALNMGPLLLIGTRLHDEIGRGNFLALYLASGTFGSLVSLMGHSLILKNLATTSLGASGAMCSLIAAWCMLHQNEKLTIFFLPHELQEYISAPGWLVLAGFIAFETVSLVTPFRAANFDHFAHLGGYFMGIVGAYAWKTERQKKLREEATVFEKWLSPK